jgi:curved DNA-binding protein CbpA
MGASATYYDILKVSRQAAPEGVRCAYRKLAQRYHPDKLQGHADAVRVMAMLNEAYSVLSDPDKRACYDRGIEQAQARADAAKSALASPSQLRQAAWPWYLLYATIAFTVVSVGTVAYKMAVPAVALPAQAAGASK